MESKYTRLQNFVHEQTTTTNEHSWSKAIFSRSLFQENLDRVQKLFHKPSHLNNEGSSSSSSSSSSSAVANDDMQILLQKGDNDPILPSLSRKQRILGFMICLIMGIFCMSLATLYIPVLLIKARKFALLFTLGSLFFLSSFSMLWGPVNHFKHLIDLERLPFTVTYLLTLIGTIYYSIWVKSYFFTLIFVLFQAGALLWYVISYIPGGARGLKFFSKLFYTFVSKGVTTTLGV